MKLLSILWLAYVLIIPVILLIIWGMRLAFDGSFSRQFGAGVTLIGIFLLLIFLGFCDWYGHKWSLTKLTIGAFLGATLAAFLYCFAVIFLPAQFTYNGTTALLMSLNFIFATALIYLKTGGFGRGEEKYVKLDLLVKAVIDCQGFVGIGENDKEKLNQVKAEVQKLNQSYFRMTKLICLGCYLGTFLAYLIIIFSSNPKETNAVGLIHVLLLLASD